MADRTKKFVRRQDQKELIIHNSTSRDGHFFDNDIDVDSVYHDADRVPTFFANKAVMNKETEMGFQPSKPILWSHGKNAKKKLSNNNAHPKTEYSDVVARKPRPVSCESYEKCYSDKNARRSGRPAGYYNERESYGNQTRETRQNLKDDERASARQTQTNRYKGSYADEFKKKTVKDSEEIVNSQRHFQREKSFEDFEVVSEKDIIVNERQSSPEYDHEDDRKYSPIHNDKDSSAEKVYEERASYKSKEEGTKVKPKPRWNSNFQKPEYPNIYAEQNDNAQKPNAVKKTNTKKFTKKDGAFPKRFALPNQNDNAQTEESRAAKSHPGKTKAGKKHNEKTHGKGSPTQDNYTEESHTAANVHTSKNNASKSHASERHTSERHTPERHDDDTSNSRSTKQHAALSHSFERQTTLPSQPTSLIDFEALKKKHASCCTECVSARARSADHIRALSREHRPRPLPLDSLTITEEDELEKSMIFINDAVTALGMMQKLMDNVGSTKNFLEKVYQRLGSSQDVARCRGNMNATSDQDNVDEKEQDHESDESSIEEALDYEANESVRVYENNDGGGYHWEPSSKSDVKTSKGNKKDKNLLELTKEWQKRNPNRRYSRN